MTVNIACVKSEMFGTPFFSGAMSFHAVDRQVLPPDDPRWDTIFTKEEEAQRKLVKSRVLQTIVPYLLENKNNAFFSALTLILVPADGSELKEGLHYHFKPTNGNPQVGELVIEDDVMLFIADGQHRREAIAQALVKDKTIGRQNVPIIFVPYRGTLRARQLFTDLNLNAKPVSKTKALALETRDPVVVATKRVASEVELFRGPPSRVNMESNSLSARSRFVVSMNTLKVAHQDLLAALYGVSVKDLSVVPALLNIKDVRPEDSRVASVAEPLASVWKVVFEHLPQWQTVIEGEHPGKLRDGPEPETDPWGGYIFAFGIGWQAIAVAASVLIRMDRARWKQALGECLDKVEWQKGSHWNGIAMVGTRVNNTGPGVKATAGYILEAGGVRALVDAKPPTVVDGKSVDEPGFAQARALFETLDKSRVAISTGDVIEDAFADAAE